MDYEEQQAINREDAQARFKLLEQAVSTLKQINMGIWVLLGCVIAIALK